MNKLRLVVERQDLIFETKGGVFSAREIDPGTRLLAETLPSTDKTLKSKSILDLGCGYGVLGVVAAKLNPEAKVTMSDDSLRATKMVQRSVELNLVKNAEVVLSDGFSNLEGKFDVILSNLPLGYGNELVEELIADAARHLNTGGEVWVVTQNRFKDLMKGWIEKYLGGFAVVARGREHFVGKGIRRYNNGNGTG